MSKKTGSRKRESRLKTTFFHKAKNTFKKKQQEKSQNLKPMNTQIDTNKSKEATGTRKETRFSGFSKMKPFHYENMPTQLSKTKNKTIKTEFKNESEQLNIQIDKIQNKYLELFEKEREKEREAEKKFKLKKEQCLKYIKNGEKEIRERYSNKIGKIKYQMDENLRNLKQEREKLYWKNLKNNPFRNKKNLPETLNVKKKLSYMPEFPRTPKKYFSKIKEEAIENKEIRKPINNNLPPRPLRKRGESLHNWYVKDLSWQDLKTRMEKKKKEDPVKWAEALHKEVENNKNTANKIRKEMNENEGIIEALKEQFIKNAEEEYEKYYTKKSVYNKVVNIAGTSYKVACNAVGKCFLRSKGKLTTAKRDKNNSNKTKTRKANRV